MISTETRLDAQRRVDADNRVYESLTRRVPAWSPIVKRSPTFSTPKYPLCVGIDDLSNDLVISATISGPLLSSAVLAALAQFHLEYTETLGEEGMDSHQQGQTLSLHDIPLQSFRMQRALEDRITVIESTAKKANETPKRGSWTTMSFKPY